MEKGASHLKQKKRIPTCEEQLHILLRLYDTYINYYIPKNLLALCSGGPAPLARI